MKTRSIAHCRTTLATLAGLWIGLSSASAQVTQITCSEALFTCLGPIGGGISPAYDVTVTTTGGIKENKGFGIYVRYNGYKLGSAAVTTSGSQADAIRTDADGSYVFTGSLTATAHGSSADGINIAANASNGADAIIYVSRDAHITTTHASRPGTAVRVNNFIAPDSRSIAILPGGSVIEVNSAGTATNGSTTSSVGNESYGYGVYAGNRNRDINNIGTSGQLAGQNNNARGDSYAFIGGHSSIATYSKEGHAVYANKNGFIQLGDGVSASTSAQGAHALYAATEQQGTYPDNVRPGFIYLEGGVALLSANGEAGSDGTNNIVMQANGADSIIANKAIDIPQIPWDDWTQQGGQWDKLPPIDRTATVDTAGVFNVAGIMDARNGGAILLDMTDGSLFVGATDAHPDLATSSAIHLNMAGAASTWSINADSSLSSLNLDAGATLEPRWSATNAPTDYKVQGDIHSNGGIINLINHTAGDIFTDMGHYGAEQGWLGLDTVLGDENSDTDKLVIDGSTSGTTALRVNPVGGNGAPTQGDGILVVEVTGDSSGEFVLDNAPLTAGNHEYKLTRGTANANNWYLKSSTGATPPPPPTQPGPNAAAAVPTLEQMSLGLLALLLAAGAAATRWRSAD